MKSQELPDFGRLKLSGKITNSSGDTGSFLGLPGLVVKVLAVTEAVSVYTEFRLNFVKIYWLTIILVSHLIDGKSGDPAKAHAEKLVNTDEDHGPGVKGEAFDLHIISSRYLLNVILNCISMRVNLIEAVKARTQEFNPPVKAASKNKYEPLIKAFEKGCDIDPANAQCE